MKSVSITLAIVAAALAFGLVALGGTAHATHVSAAITVPDEATVGQPVEVRASLRSAGENAPIAGVAVGFFMDAAFAGVEGEVELGRAVTDENGIAVLTHEPRTASEHEIRIEYVLPGESEPETATKAISVVDAGVQLHQSSAGVQIPGLNVWVLIALVSTVWAVLLSVAVRVIAIARAGADTGPDARAPGVI